MRPGASFEDSGHPVIIRRNCRLQGEGTQIGIASTPLETHAALQMVADATRYRSMHIAEAGASSIIYRRPTMSLSA
jgi:hypothetical protein